MLLLSVFLTSSSVFLKLHFMSHELPRSLGVDTILLIVFDAIFSLYAWLALISTIMAAMLWTYVITKAELSVAYPMASLSYIIMLVFAYLIFDEPITTAKILGITVILVGVWILSR